MNVPKLRFKEFNDEWTKIDLSTCFEYFSTNSLSREQLSDYGIIKNIHYGDIHKKYGNVVDVENDVATYIKDTEQINKYEFCCENDIIFADASEDYDGIGKAIELINVNEKLVSGLHTIHARDKKQFFSPLFKGYYFNTPIIHNQIRILANGFKVFGISKDNINNLKVMLPSKQEQDKIAKLLSLLDKKIQLQTKKIEALKLFKKGLSPMIFNFINIISEKKLGNICSIKTGKLDANAMTTNGKYRFYTCAKNYYYTDNYAFDNEALLISGNGAYVGYIHYYKGKFNAYQRTYVLDSFLENIQYVKVYLEEFLPKRISLEKKEGNTPYIVLSTLYDMKIKLTDSKTEDKVINLFFYVNSKIKQESEKFNKYNELKKGLIQSMFI